MKVLVIDDDPNAQKILRALFQKLGCEPVVCSGAEDALQHALSDDPPWIITCDWKPPILDSPDFCRRLRAAKPRFRPYVIVLTTKSSKDELAAALDAGADDFITKPFNLVEMQARVRAAVRLVSYQSDLQRQAAEASSMAERNKLLGEMLSNQNGTRIPKIMQGAAAAVTSVKRSIAPACAPHEFNQYDIRYIVSASLIELRLVLESTKDRLVPPSLRGEEFCTWSPILLHTSEVWLDLIISGSVSDASILFERSLSRRPAGLTEIMSFMTELTRIVSGGFLRTLRMRETHSSQPFPPRAILLRTAGSVPPMIPKTRCHDVIVEGCTFRLILASATCAREEVSPLDLREQDILAEQLPPAAVSGLPLFHKGTIMSSHFVNKLHEYAEHSEFDYTAFRHRPSLIALQLLNC